MSDNETPQITHDLLRRWPGHPRLRERNHRSGYPHGLDEVRHGRARHQSFTVEGEAPAITWPECLAAMGDGHVQ
jgi:hypothetical protein